MKDQLDPLEWKRALAYYGFLEDPFDLKPDPKYLFFAPSHWGAFRNMMAGVKERKGLILVTGEVGIGKTILVQALLNDLDEKIKTSFISQTKSGFEGILGSLLADLEDPALGKEEALAARLIRLKRYLKQCLPREEIVVLVIDEAQSLDETVLAALVNLAEPDVPGPKPLQILLVGHPELEEKINSIRARLFKKDRGAVNRIKTLNREEVGEYVRHRARVAGGAGAEIFTEKALAYIASITGGNPRRINILANRALSEGYQGDYRVIDEKIVRKALKKSKYLALPKSHQASYVFWFLLLSAAVFLFSLAFFFITLFGR